MNDYYCLSIKTEPASEEIYDLMSAYLAEAGFESFIQEAGQLKAYIKKELYPGAVCIREIRDIFPIELSNIEFLEELIEGQDWNEEWEKNYFQPIVIDRRCVIHSTFHKDIPECEYEIVIDPRMAFGTGHHATTSMMMTHILNTDMSGKNVIDMGTGTGILAILCKKLGASDVTGIEIDPGAWENAVENTDLNSVQVRMINGDVKALDKCEKADIFLANINRNIILADLKEYCEHIVPDGKLIISGFLIEDVPLMETAAARYGMKIVNKLTEGDWCSLMLSR